MRGTLRRKKGFIPLFGTRIFIIKDMGIDNISIEILLPGQEENSFEQKITKKYSISKYESKNLIIANGIIVPDNENPHKGSVIFLFPNNEDGVLDFLDRMFVTDKVTEIIHGYCGFVKHFSNYNVFINEKRLGIISEILINRKPMQCR